MCIVMLEVDVVTNVTRSERFENKWCIHTFIFYIRITKCWNTLLIFCTDFPQIYNVDESTLVAEIQSHSADFGQSEFYRKLLCI